MPTRLLTVAEVARLLNEHPETTRTRLRRGEITAVKKSEGSRAAWRVSEKAVEAFIHRRRYNPAA